MATKTRDNALKVERETFEWILSQVHKALVADNDISQETFFLTSDMAFSIGGEIVASRLARMGVARELVHASWGWNVMLEVATQWLPHEVSFSPRMTSRHQPSADEVATLKTPYDLFCQDVRPDIPQHTEEPSEIQTVNRIFVNRARYIRSFQLDEARVRVASHAQAAKSKLRAMRELRGKLWDELQPGSPFHDGCGPWEVLFPSGVSFSRCFKGASDNGEPIILRAQRRFDDGGTFFLWWRHIDKTASTRKICLLIRPGVTQLTRGQKRSLQEAWELVESWIICLSIVGNISLLDFIEAMAGRSEWRDRAPEIRRLIQEERDVAQEEKAIGDDKCKIEKDIESLPQESKKLDQEANKLKKTATRTRVTIADYQSRKIALVSQLESVNQQLIRLEERLARKTKEHEDASQRRDSARTAEAKSLSQLTTQLDELNRKLGKASDRGKSLQEKRKRLVDEMADQGLVKRAKTNKDVTSKIEKKGSAAANAPSSGGNGGKGKEETGKK
ncbi:hypothetical protein OQA88_13290 [Cercophora sp. LCS_1]